MSLILLFLSSFAAATVLPLSSEVPLAVIVRQTQAWPVPVIVATAGNLLGACTTYWLGRAAVKVAHPSARTERAAALLARHGAPVLLLSWVPLIGDLFVVLAGAGRLPFAAFVAWTAMGKLARYVAVAFAALEL